MAQLPFLMVSLVLLLWPRAWREDDSRAPQPEGGSGRVIDAFGLRLPRGLSGRGRLLAGTLVLLATGLGVAAVILFPEVGKAYPPFPTVGWGGARLMAGLLLTAALLLATELFYRGVALFALEERWGVAAIYLLVPIYGLDHVGAPASELVASFFAGALLGHLALRTRSIWPGFIAHTACALAVTATSVLLS